METNKRKNKVKREKDDDGPEYKWWLENSLPEGKKWKTLEHNGVLFPPDYQPHGVPLIYDGKKIHMAPESEEVATFFAMYIESDHMRKPTFLANFFNEFKQVLKTKDKVSLYPISHILKAISSKKLSITDLRKCDFSEIREHLLREREERKNRTKEEKQIEKAEKDRVQKKYGFAIVDGYEQKISNYRVEPPGLFLGRGNHPKSGMLKVRIQPEDITLNLGKKAKVPPCPIPGHNWGNIIHNDEVSWLAMWKDNINNDFKYVWLAPNSRIKGEADIRKFETARKLKNYIGSIRNTYTKELKSKDSRIRQRATALYLIDHLALRVGNEKDEDEADTVGCCSLRTEHVKLKTPNIVGFDFLGKDSMRYQNSIGVTSTVFTNIKSFMESKEPNDELFDELTVSALNKYLKSKMEGLTAKVFRTYNASICLESELKKSETGEKRLVDEELLCYNRANRQVAILCNHQRSVSKNFGEQIGKIDEKIGDLQEKLDELKECLEEENLTKKRKREAGPTSAKRRRVSNDPERVAEQISKLKKRIKILKTRKTGKDEMKAVALNTSKINYIDPRISVAWAKRVNVPLEKIFSKALRQKFPWAMDVDKDYRF